MTTTLDRPVPRPGVLDIEAYVPCLLYTSDAADE